MTRTIILRLGLNLPQYRLVNHRAGISTRCSRGTPTCYSPWQDGARACHPDPGGRLPRRRLGGADGGGYEPAALLEHAQRAEGYLEKVRAPTQHLLPGNDHRRSVVADRWSRASERFRDELLLTLSVLAVAKPTLQAYMIAGQHRLSADPSHFESLMERAEDDYPNDAVLMQFRGKMYHHGDDRGEEEGDDEGRDDYPVRRHSAAAAAHAARADGRGRGQTLDSALSAADKDHAIYAAKAPGSLKAACERFDEQDGAAHPAYIEALLFATRSSTRHAPTSRSCRAAAESSSSPAFWFRLLLLPHRAAVDHDRVGLAQAKETPARKEEKAALPAHPRKDRRTRTPDPQFKEIADRAKAGSEDGSGASEELPGTRGCWW